jgi:lipoprotein-releasing system ATP-binding protein
MDALLLGDTPGRDCGLHCQLCSGSPRLPFAAGRNAARIKRMSAEVSLSCQMIERYLGEDESRVHALRGVSLELEPGTVHAVVGPSGCGKSTLLYILGLLDSPDAGSVLLQSKSVSHLPDDELSRQRNEFIGFIFQFHFLMEDFTAQENVMIPMRRLGRLSEGEMAERAAELLDAVGLGEKIQRPSRHLSGGEQQRVAIARALANDPSVILADEPTGNLDTANSRRAFDLMQSIVVQKQKALLLVTHNPRIAEACDWIHEMKDGRIVVSHPRGPTRATF